MSNALNFYLAGQSWKKGVGVKMKLKVVGMKLKRRYTQYEMVISKFSEKLIFVIIFLKPFFQKNLSKILG